MATGRIQQRIDRKLQQKAEDILGVQGIKPSQAIVLFYTEVARTGGLPFHPSPVSREEIPNARLQRDLKSAQKKGGIRLFKTKKDMFASLRGT